MKKVVLTLLAAGTVWLTGCDKVEKLANFGIDHTFEEVIPLEVSDTDTTVYYGEFVIDISENQKMVDNLSNIASYNFKRISYKITSFTGDEAITGDGKMRFFDDEGNIGDPINLDQIHFQEMVDSGTEKELVLPEKLVAEIERRLLSKKKVSVSVGGTVSDKPMTADFLILIEVRANVEF